MAGTVFGARRRRQAAVAAFSAGIVGRISEQIADDPALLLAARLWADGAARGAGRDRQLLRLAAAPELAGIRVAFEASPGLWSHRRVPRTRLGRRYRAGLLHDQVTVSVTRPDWPVWS